MSTPPEPPTGPRSAPPDRHRARFGRVIPALLLAATVALAGAQTLVAGAAAGDRGPSLAAGLEGLAVAGIDLDLGLTGGQPAGGSRLAVEAALRSNLPFGPLGSVVFRGDARVATDGRAAAGVSAGGSYGPLALELAVALASTDRASFLPAVDPLAVAEPSVEFGEGPLRAGAALGAQLRLAGGWIAELEPELLALQRDSNWTLGGRLAGALRLRRAFDDDDLALLLHGFVAPAGAARPGSAAVGLAYVLNERRAPSWTGALWLGAGRLAAPGATLVGALRDGPVRLELALAAEPFRSDVAPYRAALRAVRQGDAPLAGEWRLGAELQLGADGAARGALSLGYALELSE